MPHIFDTSSLEAKILLLLIEVYPITDKEIATYLEISPRKVNACLQTLVKKGLVRLEPLPDTNFVTIASGDFQFKGKETEQLKKVQEKMKKRKEFKTPDDNSGGMYG
jgi:predicted ArsR family transcriptional regulator